MDIRLNEEQLKQLSNICGNLSILFFGTVFTPVFTGVDIINPLMIVYGYILGVVFFSYSLLFLRSDI
jgi:hypothetical protein